MEHLKSLISKLRRLEKQLEEIREIKQSFKNEDEGYLEAIQRYNALQKEAEILLYEKDHIKREYNALSEMADEITGDRQRLQTRLIVIICALFLDFLLAFSNPPIFLLVNILVIAVTVDSYRKTKRIKEKQLNYSRKVRLIGSKSDTISSQMDRVYDELKDYTDINATLGMHDKMVGHLENAEEFEAKKLEEIEYLKQYIFGVYSKKIIGKTSLQKEEITKFIEEEVPGLLSEGAKKMVLVNNESDN